VLAVICALNVMEALLKYESLRERLFEKFSGKFHDGKNSKMEMSNFGDITRCAIVH